MIIIAQFLPFRLVVARPPPRAPPWSPDSSWRMTVQSVSRSIHNLISMKPFPTSVADPAGGKVTKNQNH